MRLKGIFVVVVKTRPIKIIPMKNLQPFSHFPLKSYDTENIL